MPLFVVSCTDHEGTVEKRLATRPQHIARLQKLNDEGRLIVAVRCQKIQAIHKPDFMAVPLLLTLKRVKHWIHGCKKSLS